MREGDKNREKHITIKTLKFQTWKSWFKNWINKFLKVKTRILETSIWNKQVILLVHSMLQHRPESWSNKKNLVNWSDKLKNLGKDLVFNKKEISALTVCQYAKVRRSSIPTIPKNPIFFSVWLQFLKTWKIQKGIPKNALFFHLNSYFLIFFC